MNPISLTEATPALNTIQQTQAFKGRFKALLIKAGWGSSGYYSEALLRRDGPKVWPAGTQNYLDHPTLSDARELPERSVRDYASVIVTDPVWDPVEKGLVSEVEVFPQWRNMLNEEFASAIGLSIRACGIAEFGEAEGREGQIITELTEGLSVDWVTKAGAGGKVLQLIESVRDKPNHDVAVREAGPYTANELKGALSDAVRETYGGDGIYTWVKDNTTDWVVFAVEDSTDCDLFQQTYTANPDTNEVTLTGEPVEVVARTTYEPAPPDPDDTDGEQITENEPGAPPAYDTKEGTVPELTDDQKAQLAEAVTLRAELDATKTQLAEANAATTELDETKKQLAEAAAVAERVTGLEQKLAEAAARNQRLENDRGARAACVEALKTSGLPELTHTRITESVCRDLPTVEGVLDTAQLAEAITSAITSERTYVAALTEAAGAGMPRGLGGSLGADVSDADLDKQLAEAFAGFGMDEKTARTAANGRG